MNIHILKAENEQLRAQVKKLREDLDTERKVNINLKNKIANPKKSS